MPDQPLTEHKPAVKYIRMEDGTREEYHLLTELAKPFKTGIVDRILAHLDMLKNSYPGERVTRYEHSLQTATRAHRDGADEEIVVGALLHDIGDMIAQDNHAELAAVVLAPYVSPRTHWVIQQHGLFQGYYYFHHFDMNKNERDRYKDHPYYPDCVEFCAKWDQMAFDPEYDTMPIEEFRPMVERIFAREPWGPHTKA